MAPQDSKRVPDWGMTASAAVIDGLLRDTHEAPDKAKGNARGHQGQRGADEETLKPIRGLLATSLPVAPAAGYLENQPNAYERSLSHQKGCGVEDDLNGPYHDRRPDTGGSQVGFLIAVADATQTSHPVGGV